MTPPEFWQRVAVGQPDECWPWLGMTNGQGRGRVWFEGRLQYAYRVAWQLTHGAAIPNHLLACHRCDNPICVNPSHIFLGTPRDNSQDAATKGRFRPNPRRGIEHHAATVSSDLVARAVGEYLAGGGTQAEVAGRYGVTQSALSLWLRGKVRLDAGLSPNGRPLKPCGTHAAYVRHVRRGEKACPACLAAEREHGAAQRAKRGAA